MADDKRYCTVIGAPCNCGNHLLSTFCGGKRPTTCSVTGKRCRCGSTTGCFALRTSGQLDTLADKDVQALKWAAIHVASAIIVLDDNLHIDDYRRSFPGPELREIRRKLTTAKAMIQDLL